MSVQLYVIWCVPDIIVLMPVGVAVGVIIPSFVSVQVAPASVYESPTVNVTVWLPLSTRVGGVVSGVDVKGVMTTVRDTCVAELPAESEQSYVIVYVAGTRTFTRSPAMVAFFDSSLLSMHVAPCSLYVPPCSNDIVVLPTKLMVGGSLSGITNDTT